MVPIVCFIGRSNSGKTTLLEKIISKMTKRGYRVGTIKHDVHGFDIDKEGKDSWRHKKAGAKTVVVSSSQKTAVIRDVDKELELDQIRFEYLKDVDIVMAEGYKQSKNPKIEVLRKKKNTELICKDDEQLIAVATDAKIDINCPVYDINDADGIADLIEESFIKKTRDDEISVVLMVNDRWVPLKPFIRDFLGGSIKGMINSLKGCKEPVKIEIKIT